LRFLSEMGQRMWLVAYQGILTAGEDHQTSTINTRTLVPSNNQSHEQKIISLLHLHEIPRIDFTWPLLYSNDNGPVSPLAQ